MRVEPIGRGPSHAAVAQLTRRVQPGHVQAPAQAEVVADQAPRAAQTLVDGGRALPAGSETPGVIRLLESGHFKGVADVRLRINFFDQLAVRQAAAAAPDVRAGAESLLGQVGQQVQGALGALGLDDAQQAAVADALDALAAEVGDAVEGFVAGGSTDLDALAGTIQSAFDRFIEQLIPVLSAPLPDAEPAAQDADAVAAESADAPSSPAADEPAAQPVPTGDEALASLRELFAQALEGFVSSLSASVAYPDPAAPTGHGAAYDKFLAMYNALRGASTTVDQIG